MSHYSIDELLGFKMGQPSNALGLVEVVGSVCVVGYGHAPFPVALYLLSGEEGEMKRGSEGEGTDLEM